MAGLTGVTATTMSGGGDDLENERSGMGAAGMYMVDTAPVRRDKGVVSATFEVVIGTRDSERRKGKQKEEEKPVVIQEPPVAEPAHHHEAATGNGDRPYSSHPPDDDYWGYNYHDWSYDHSNGHGHGHFLGLVPRRARTLPRVLAPLALCSRLRRLAARPCAAF